MRIGAPSFSSTLYLFFIMSTSNLKVATLIRYCKQELMPRLRAGMFNRVSGEFVARAGTYVERIVRELEAEQYDDAHGPELQIDFPDPLLDPSVRDRINKAYERKLRRWLQRQVQAQPSRGQTLT